MSTVAEIRTALTSLDMDALLEVEGAIHFLQRSKSSDIIFDDDYGLWTAEDQASAAAEAWKMLDDGKKPDEA